MLIFIAAIAWVFVGSLAVWTRAKPRGGSILLGGAILATAQIIGVMLIAGALGAWQREIVFSVTVLINTALIAWGRARLLDLYRRLRSDVAACWIDLRRSPAAMTILIIALLAWLIIFGLGSLLPPTDFDGLAQHIPIASFHLQRGQLAPIDTPYRGIRAYPANGSLLIGWSMLIAGDDAPIDLVQWPFWLIGALAIYQLARQAGADRSGAVVGSVVFSAAPVVALQARSDYVDLILAGVILAALALTLDRSLPTRWVAVVVGSALGVIIGVKYAGAINAVVLSIGVFMRLVIDRRGARRKLIGDAIVVGLLILGLGGYWYARNWIDLGNPFWPISVQIGGLRIFDGVWTTATFYQDALPASLNSLPYPLQVWTVWRESLSSFAPDMRLGGLGPVWLAIGLPSFIFYVLQSLHRRDRRALGVIAFAIGTFVLTPANWHTRYVLAPIAISGMAIAMMLAQLDRWPRLILNGLIVGLSIYSLSMAIVRGPIAPIDVERFARLPQFERRSVLIEQVAAVKPAMRWFSQNVPDDAIVAYGWSGVVLYPFWEHAPARHMIYVPPDAPAWFDTLRVHGAEYLVARQDSAEAQAAASDARFRALYSDDSYTIYTLTQ